MAQMVRLVDDIDKESDADETLTFAFAGREYDIDLCDENAQQMKDEFGFWIQHARKRGTVPKVLTPRKAAEADPPDGADTDEFWVTPPDASPAEQKRYQEMRNEIREWGVLHGFPSLSGMGRIPRALGAKWGKAHRHTDSRHRKPDPEEENTDPTETDTEQDQDTLALTPRFSAGKRKPPAKKTSSRAASPVRVAS